jgi:RNA-splicing ligase RtcB
MIELKGKYNKDCKIFIDEVELDLYPLIQNVLDQPASEGVPIRIMPDTHVGKGICIGFTMPITNMLNPNFCGVDIGCGMLSAKFSNRYKVDLKKLDVDVKMSVPMGFNIHEDTKFKFIPFKEVQETADRFVVQYNEIYGTSYTAPTYNEKWLSKKLKDIKIEENKFWNAIGTLGGGNHFIEMGLDSNKDYWITIHSGSRNFGLKIADYWTNVAKTQMTVTSDVYNKELDDIKLNTFPMNLIPKKIKELKDKYSLGVNKEYLQGDNMMGYLFDMIFAQKYAEWNRSTMLEIIQKLIEIDKFDEVISTVHNYIDMKDMIIRKGAISSYEGQKMIIPWNQRDGIIVCEGKSNKDWNCSAPHGAGRKWSRSKAKEMVTVEQVKESMKGIYTTSVCKETLDESVFAYKNSEIIEKLIEPTATILDRIKPIWNVKDTGKDISWKEKKDLQKKGRKDEIVQKYRTDKEKDIRKECKESRKARGKY